MISGFAKKIATVEGYVRDNRGSPFIVFFVLLVLPATVFLSMDVAGLANEVATYLYYALVIGIVSQSVCFIKCSKKSGEKNYDSS